MLFNVDSGRKREYAHLVIHAAKTALAAGLCWWLAMQFGLHDGYWGAISAIIVLQSNFGSTITASRDRILGTMIGAVIGFSFSLFWTLPWNYVLALLVAVFICGLLGFRSSSRLAGVTITIVMLVGNATSHWRVALDRVGQVVLGIVVALLVATLIFPDRARLRLRDGLAQEFLAMGTFFDAILKGLRGAPSERLAAVREGALAMLRENSQLLAEARNEPSGGPGWREGLNALVHFGRSLFDALVALEFAVRDSHADNYADQLEPELGLLIEDIRRSFGSLSTCIRAWRFRHSPDAIDLEADIADLEAKMAAVRHSGSRFSQAEILRAYALQLHLKQIARLISDSRLEAAAATGEVRPVSP
jgi:uncharacterized membrane protein YccC